MKNATSKWFLLLMSLNVVFFYAGCRTEKVRADVLEHRTRASRGSHESEFPREVETIELSGEKFSSHLELSGKALAARESYLSFSAPGLIQEILVERGQRVKKGQVLARLDRRGFSLGVERARAALDGADAAREQLGTEIARIEKLLSSGAAPSAARDDLLARDKGARAQVRIADAALRQAKKVLRDTQLRAPYDGVITEIFKQEGEQAPAMPPTMILKIVDSSQLEVQVFVPEAAARFIAVGTVAEVEVESVGVTATGRAIFVSSSIQPGARTFETRILIDNAEGTIKAGSFSRVRLTREMLEDAILIPISSVSRDEQGRPHVFIARGNLARRTNVILGTPNGARVLVERGLLPGQKLITSGITSLRDGQSILEPQVQSNTVLK